MMRWDSKKKFHIRTSLMSVGTWAEPGRKLFSLWTKSNDWNDIVKWHEIYVANYRFTKLTIYLLLVQFCYYMLKSIDGRRKSRCVQLQHPYLYCCRKMLKLWNYMQWWSGVWIYYLISNVSRRWQGSDDEVIVNKNYSEVILCF